MALASPYLQVLLSRKRNDPSLPYNRPDDLTAAPEQVDSPGPTIPLRSPQYLKSANAPVEQPAAPPPYLQPASVSAAAPVVSPAASQPVSVTPPPTTPVITKPRDVIQDDRNALIAAQNKPHSKLKSIAEGLGQWAGSGIGLNVHKLIHPGGTETERAQRQLVTDLGLQKTATDNADAQSTIALRGKQGEKIAADIEAAKTDTSGEDKRKLDALRESLRLHTQPFDPNDPVDVQLLKDANAAGILIPSAYGKQPAPPKPATAPETRTRMEGGVKYQTEFDPESKKFVFSTDGDGKRIVVDEAKPESEAKGIETPEQFGTRQRNFNAAYEKHKSLLTQEANAAKEKDAAYKALADIRTTAQSRMEDGKLKPGDATAISEAEKRAEAAQKLYAGFGEKKTAARADVLKYAEGTDANGEPVAPKQVAAQSKSASSPKLTIEGAVDRFKEVHKRDPTPDEVTKMKALLP